MPLDISQFQSSVQGQWTSRSNQRVTVNTVNNEHKDVQLQSGSRFRLVRWIRDRGFGLGAQGRAQNRSAVDAFIGALEKKYGEDTVRGTGAFKQLEDLKQRGKPLRVRHIRTAIDEAGEKHQDVLLAKIDAGQSAEHVDEVINKKITAQCQALGAAGHNGVECLIRDIGANVDRTLANEEFTYEVRQAQDKGYNLPSGEREAGQAVTSACNGIFLSGYGFQTSQKETPRSHRLTALLVEFPDVRAGAEWELSRALEDPLKEGLENIIKNPELPAGNMNIKDKIAHKVDKLAKQLIREYGS